MTFALVDNYRTHRDHIPRIFHVSNGDFPASFRIEPYRGV
jgi:hypothetical protein